MKLLISYQGETGRNVPRNEIVNFICALLLPLFRKKFNIILHLLLHAVFVQYVILY